jgi:hypothetical protein
MVDKLARDSLTAQLASARRLEGMARAAGDSLGAMQFQQQSEALEAELETLAERPEKLASLAVFFGGEPVLGNHGVKADFAGKALEDLQGFVKRRFAVAETGGALGARGRVPLGTSADLLVTGVRRGSFGFVLEEAAVNEPTVQTALVDTVDEAARMVSQLASPNDEDFEEAAALLDNRSLAAVRNFFETLDKAGASVRIVEGDRDFSIGSADVRRAFTRTSSMNVIEREPQVLRGRLHLLPRSRRFEFDLLGTGEVIAGTVASGLKGIVPEEGQAVFESPEGKLWRAHFQVREVQRLNQPPKRYFTLVGLIDEIRRPPQ